MEVKNVLCNQTRKCYALIYKYNHLLDPRTCTDLILKSSVCCAARPVRWLGIKKTTYVYHMICLRVVCKIVSWLKIDVTAESINIKYNHDGE